MNTPDISNLNYTELAQLRDEVIARIKEMRENGIVQLRATIVEQAQILEVDFEDLMPKKRRVKRPARRYQDPDNPDNRYGGKGKKPQWLKDALASGRTMEEFLVDDDKVNDKGTSDA